MPMPGKEIKDSILICLLNDPQNPYKIGLINPSLPLGKKVRVQDYDEGIVNSELCTFRNFIVVVVRKFTELILGSCMHIQKKN